MRCLVEIGPVVLEKTAKTEKFTTTKVTTTTTKDNEKVSLELSVQVS